MDGDLQVTQTGENGKTGSGDSSGGNGQPSLLNNFRLGLFDSGPVTLAQNAVGGEGGGSDGGKAGAGGEAISNLTYQGFPNRGQSASVSAGASAVGGEGGEGDGGSNGGAGGDATAALNVTGAAQVSAVSDAAAGAGGAVDGGGGFQGRSGVARAVTVVSGASGTYSATASASAATGLVTEIDTTASGTVDGTSTAEATAAIGRNLSPAIWAGALSAFDASSFPIEPPSLGIATETILSRWNLDLQSVALGEGAPGATITAPVFKANPNIGAAFGASPVFFAVGEMGGGYSVGGSGVQTTVSQESVTVDLADLSSPGELVVGLFNGQAVGNGVTSVSLVIASGDTILLDDSGLTAAQAKALFTNDGIGDLQILANSGSETLSITLTVETSSPGSGFYGDFIIGDPPPTTASASQMAQAMASFGTAQGAMSASSAYSVSEPEPWLAAPLARTSPMGKSSPMSA